LDSIFADKREQRAKTAQLALAALGDEAAPVIDEVWKLTYVNNHQIADRALAVLSRTGTNGMRALIQIVNDPRHPRSSWAVPHFRDTKYLGTNASQAVDLLVRLALSHDVGYDHMATVELGLLGLDPEKAVPALQTVLNTRDNWRRSLAAESLGQFGPNAGPALPDLFKAFADPDPHLNRVVRQAILEIEPNALSAGPPGGRP
jgi:HEAT repeat protein